MPIKKGKIGNALESVAPDHVIAVAADVFDETLNKYQSELNQQIGQGGYTPPAGGIPKTDLASDVQASLGKADNAVPNTRKVNGKALSSDITLGASDVNALPSSTTIPTTLSQMSDDATHRTVTDTEKASWNDKYTKQEVNNMLVSAPEANVVVIENPSGADPTTLLPATPAANTIYRVMSANGTYFIEYEHNGTKYVKLADRQYGIDTKPMYKSQNLIDSNGAYGILENSLKNTSYLSENETLSYTENVGFYYDDGPHFNLTSFRYRIYQVQPNNVYTFTSHFGTNTDIPFVYWLDSSQNIIGKEPFTGNAGSGSAPVTYIDQPIVSPSNASYLVLNKNNDAAYDANVKAVGDAILSRDLKRQVTGAVHDIEALSRNISISQLDELLIVGSPVTGKFINDNGAEGSNAYFKYQKYNVSGGEIYTFSGGFYYANIHFVHWYDANDKYLGYCPYIGPSNQTIIRYVDQPVIAPKNATYALLNVQIDDVPDNVYNFKHVVARSENLVDLRKDLRGILCKKTELEKVNPSEGVGKFYYDDGPRSNGSFTYYKYAVEQKKLYTFSSYFGSNTDIYFIYWLDVNGNIIGREPYHGNAGSGSAPVTYIDQPIIAPSNAAFVILNTSSTVSKEKNVKEVGDVGAFMAMRGYLPPCSLSDVRESGTWLLIDTYTYTDKPIDASVGWLRVSVIDERWVLQEFLSWDGKYFKRQFISGRSAGSWVAISGGGDTYNITNEFNNIQQTVNLTATPSITADTNNYLAPSGNTNDRTADILAMLSSNGICRLGAGTYWVDSLVMPSGSSIIGSGNATKIKLKSGSNKFAIKMNSYCTVDNVCLEGSDSTITPSATVGTRHGILWQGTYTANKNAPNCSMVSNVWINNFNGGGITCTDTGYGTWNFMAVTNVNIYRCDAGINVSYWSEFHKFTNVRTYSCYYGCINNGGNNVFVNCDFSSCTGVAFLMDNAQNQSPNNSHGSCVACVFNHTASNSGDGIKILNCDSGFVFDGCQIFFSKIHIEDSDGVAVTSCNFGYSNCDIYVSGGGAALFANNLHQGKPTITITNNNKTHFVNCYVRSTGEVVTA